MHSPAVSLLSWRRCAVRQRQKGPPDGPLDTPQGRKRVEQLRKCSGKCISCGSYVGYIRSQASLSHHLSCKSISFLSCKSISFCQSFISNFPSHYYCYLCMSLINCGFSISKFHFKLTHKKPKPKNYFSWWLFLFDFFISISIAGRE